jgi:hypothetical protein
LFWKSREEDEVDHISTHPESSELVGGAAHGGKSDTTKCAGTVITEVFKRIDMRLNRIPVIRYFGDTRYIFFIFY